MASGFGGLRRSHHVGCNHWTWQVLAPNTARSVWQRHATRAAEVRQLGVESPTASDAPAHENMTSFRSINQKLCSARWVPQNKLLAKPARHSHCLYLYPTRTFSVISTKRYHGRNTEDAREESRIRTKHLEESYPSPSLPKKEPLGVMLSCQQDSLYCLEKSRT